MEIIPVKSFTRESVKQDTSYIYLFTDNLSRTSGSGVISKESLYYKAWGYGTTLYYPKKTQAVIRGLENAFPITTMFDSNRTQLSDDLYQKYYYCIYNEIGMIETAFLVKNYKGIKFANHQFGNGTYSKMITSAPMCWDYLNKQLATIGIDNLKLPK